MTENCRRKKDPERVKAQIMTAAGHLAVLKGLSAITLEGVAREAGISKGGLLHHFPSRQNLLEDLYQEVLSRFSARIKATMAEDRESRGRFTRAYIRVTTALPDTNFDSRLMASAVLVMSSNPALAELWSEWLESQLEINGEGPDWLTGQIARFAADGLWLADGALAPGYLSSMRQAIIDRLIALTYQD